MCEFISWIKMDDKIVFLNDDALADCKRNWDYFDKSKSERYGHSAIRWYYGIKEDDGENIENTDLSEPSNFPPEIVNAIKDGQITYCIDILKILNPIGLKRLSPRIAKLGAEKDKLWAEIDKLGAERDKLWAEIAKLGVEIDKLWAERDKLWAERANLGAEIDKLWAERDKQKLSQLIRKPINRIKALR